MSDLEAPLVETRLKRQSTRLARQKASEVVFLPPIDEVLREVQEMNLLVPNPGGDNNALHFEHSRICQIIKLKYLENVKEHISVGSSLTSMLMSGKAMRNKRALNQTILALEELQQHIPTGVTNGQFADSHFRTLFKKFNNRRDESLHVLQLEETSDLDTSMDAVQQLVVSSYRTLFSFMVYMTMRIHKVSDKYAKTDDVTTEWLTNPPPEEFMQRPLYFADCNKMYAATTGIKGTASTIHEGWFKPLAPFGPLVFWWWYYTHSDTVANLPEKETLVCEDIRDIMTGTIAELKTLSDTITQAQAKMMGGVATLMFTLISFAMRAASGGAASGGQ